MVSETGVHVTPYSWLQPKRIAKGTQVDIILLDFTKAFDKVPHCRLLHKLTYYGVNMNTTAWINSFLENRNQNVILEGAKSTSAQSCQEYHKARCLAHCYSWHTSTACRTSPVTLRPDCLPTTPYCFVLYRNLALHTVVFSRRTSQQ